MEAVGATLPMTNVIVAVDVAPLSSVTVSLAV